MTNIEQEHEDGEHRIDTATIEVAATPTVIWAAFATEEALMRWLPPNDMRGRAVHYDFQEGGRYSIELTYGTEGPAGGGKTSAKTDVSQGRFITLEPEKRIIQSVQFESDDPSMQGEMLMSWTFKAIEEATEVTVTASQVPIGIAKADHDAGLRSSLENLRRYVEQE